MPIFEYVALDKSGRRRRDSVDAESLTEARRRLRAAGAHLMEIRERQSSREGPAEGSRDIRAGRVRQRDLSAATRQLATLLHAGLPVVPALSALVEQLAGYPLAQVLANVRDKVNTGSTLATALEQYPRVFTEVYVNMVRAGEAAGALDAILVRLAEMTEKRVNLTNKVRAAVTYPVFMAAVGAGVVVFLLSSVIPTIAKLFLEMDRALPWPTVMLIKASAFTQSYLWLIALGVGAVVLLVRLWTSRPSGRLAWDRLMLRVPLLGGLLLKVSISRFSRTLGVLLASGVSILDALDIVKRVARNAVVAHALDNVKERVSHGDSIAGPLRASGVFPPIVFHMVATSESSGNVEQGLLNVADAYDNEVETTVTAMTSLLEPIMILVMGTVVAFIVLAILMPIFDINQAIR